MARSTGWIAFTVLLAARVGAQVPCDGGEAECGPRCPGGPGCPVEDTPRACRNGADDDGDGAIDCDDADCRALILCAARDLSPSGPLEPRVEEPGPETRFVDHPDPRRYPQAFARQPMTTHSGMLVPALGFSARDDTATDDAVVHVGLGLTYGILDDWEIAIVPLALRLAPTVEVEDPSIATTLRLLRHEIVELGVYANVTIPVVERRLEVEPLPLAHLLARSRASDVAQLDLALLVLLHLDVVRIELALPLATVLFTEPEVRGDLSFPLRVAFSVARYVYFGLESGVIVPGRTYDAPKVPLAFLAGVTFPGGERGPIADARFRFGWPTFWDRGRVGDEVTAAAWQITLEARAFAYLLP